MTRKMHARRITTAGRLLFAMRKLGRKPRSNESVDEYVTELESATPGIIHALGGREGAVDNIRRSFLEGAMIHDNGECEISPNFSMITAFSQCVGMPIREGETLGEWCARIRHQRPWTAALATEIEVREEGQKALDDLDKRIRGTIISIYLNAMIAVMMAGVIIMNHSSLLSAVGLFGIALAVAGIRDILTRINPGAS